MAPLDCTVGVGSHVVTVGGAYEVDLMREDSHCGDQRRPIATASVPDRDSRSVLGI